VRGNVFKVPAAAVNLHFARYGGGAESPEGGQRAFERVGTPFDQFRIAFRDASADLGELAGRFREKKFGEFAEEIEVLLHGGEHRGAIEHLSVVARGDARSG